LFVILPPKLGFLAGPYKNDALGESLMKTYTSNLTSKPDWLGTYGDATGKTLDTDFGFGPDGMYFIGNAGNEFPVTAYSVRTNFNISGHQACEVIFTADHTNFCSDQGICFYNDGQSPNWNWDPDPSRIAFSINCPVPNIYGTNKFANNSGEHYGSYNDFCSPGECPEAGTPVLGPGIYTFKVTYNPAARTVTAITYEGENTSGTMVDTIVLHEKLMDGGPYRIGFDADSDGSAPGTGDSPAYFKSLTINVYETNGMSDDTELNNQLSNLKEAHSQITDLVEGDLFHFADDADLVGPNFNELGIGTTVCIQEDGKIVVGGLSGTLDGSKYLRRIDVNGNEDESFTPPSFGLNGMVNSVVQMSDGRLVVGGNFLNVERFDGPSNGGSITFDADYQGGTGLNGNGLLLPYSANIVEVGWTVTFQDSSTRTVISSYFNESSNYWVVGLNSNITLNPAFPLTISQPNWKPTIDGNIVNIGGMVCLNSDGSLSKRNGGDVGFENRAISPMNVYTIKLLSDDSVLVGGHFTHYDGVESPFLAKIGSDGVIDEGFATNVLSLGLNEFVSSIAVDGNGKILIGGHFTKCIKRLNSDGSVDNSFDPGTGFTGNTFQQNGVYSILPLSNGQILAGHSSKYYNGTTCNNGLVRLNSDGSLDGSYTAQLYNENDNIGAVLAIAQQENGKVVVGGYFNLADGSSANEIFRLNSDGSKDESFNSGFGFTPAGYNWGPATNDIKLDVEGNIYVAGSFTDYNHAARFQYAKLDTNGVLQEWSVPVPYCQWGIDDGMLDLYDGANYLNTNLTQPYIDIKCNGGDAVVSGGEGQCLNNDNQMNKSIPSTHTQAWDGNPENDFYDPELDEYRYLPVCDSHVMVGDGYFGEGSNYFTAMFPGMFVLAANNINITEFSVVGNVGSDGGGTDVAKIFPIDVRESRYTAFFKTNYGAGDPSINHIIIVNGNSNGIDHFYDPTSQGDEHAIVGLTGKTKLFFLCLGKAEGVAMTTLEAKAVATKFLEIALGGCGSTTYELDLSPDNPEKNPNYRFDGEGNMDTAIIVDPITNKRVSIQRTGYFDIKDNCGNRKVVSIKDGQNFGVVPKNWAEALGSVIKVSTPEPVSNEIRIFINDTYVDYQTTGADFSQEPNNILALMDSANISYTTFTDIGQSTFASFSGGKIIIPELENGDLNPDLSSGARSAINNFVNNGGVLIMFRPNSGDLINVMNAVFGFNLDTNGASEPIALTQAGSNLFPGESSTIPSVSATSSLDSSTLPQNAVTIYDGSGSNQSVVTMIPYGSGKIYVLGWDWFDAAPVGGEDGGWNHLLKSIVTS